MSRRKGKVVQADKCLQADSVNVGSCDFCDAVHINLFDAAGAIIASANLPCELVDAFCRQMQTEKTANLQRANATAVRQ